MNQQLRLQRIRQMQQQEREIQLLFLEQAIAISVATGEDADAQKYQQRLPADHQWALQLPTPEEVDTWAVAQGQAAYEREKAKWPDERIRQFAQEVRDAQGK